MLRPPVSSRCPAALRPSRHRVHRVRAAEKRGSDDSKVSQSIVKIVSVGRQESLDQLERQLLAEAAGTPSF
jgi:hypothetical protein